MKSLKDIESSIFNKVNPAVKFSVTRYVFAVGIFAAVLAFGIISTFKLSVDLLPSVNFPVVNVQTSYSGATPDVVDQQVTQVLEGVLSTIAGVTDMNSSSSQGSSRIFLVFDASVDKNAAANQVASLVSAAVRRLPQGISNPIVQTFDPNAQAILQFGITSSNGTSLTDIADYANNTLTPLLERVDGVANITINGAPSREFQVLLDPSKLQYYQLTPQVVTNAIATASINQPIGTIISKGNSLVFATQSVPGDVQGIGNILVDQMRGVKVQDVASVRDVPTPNDFARVNGQPAVLISVQKTSDSNSVAVAKSVRALIGSQVLPSSYHIEFSNDTTGPITASVDATFRELILTALVVAIIVLLFTGKLNTAFSVILAIPIALSAAPILYNLAGFSFNLVSMLALIVAIGIVVDDSIVVSENVERYRAMGMNLKDSVFRGASEVFSAVVAASLSLLSVLIPVSFVGGTVSRYLMQFTLGLAIAVLFSLIEAVLFLTVRLAYTPEAKKVGFSDMMRSFIRLPEAISWGLTNWKKGLGIVLGIVAIVIMILSHLYVLLPFMVLWPFVLGVIFFALRIVYSVLQFFTEVLHKATEAVLVWVRERYVHGLSRSLKGGVWVLIGALLFFAGTLTFIALSGRITFNLIPQTDNGFMSVNLRLPNGTPVTVTNREAGKIETFLLRQNLIKTVQTTVGTTNAQMTVQLVSSQRPPVTAIAQQYRPQLLRLVNDEPSARVSVGAAGQFGGGGGGGASSVSLSVTASDFNLLSDRTNKIIDVVQSDPNVIDANSSLSNTVLENDFIPNQNSMQGTGLSAAAVASALQTYSTGTQASSVQIGGESYPINVQLDPKFLADGQSLLDLPIYSSALQSSLSVGQLGNFALREAPVSLSRYNRLYTSQISVDLKPDAPPALAFQNEIQAKLEKEGLLDNGVQLSSGSSSGPAALAAQLVNSLAPLFGLAIFLAYLVMGAQFNSWRYPLYLLLPVPLAIAGALWFVLLTGGQLDIFGVMGMLMLIGLSAKNAIIYLDFVVERLGKMPFLEALIDSARLRFRPIIMTTLTVVVISFPLIFSHGQGSEYGQRMGVVILGGIVSSAILTFFVVPSAFYLFERKRSAAKFEAEAEDKDKDNEDDRDKEKGIEVFAK